MMATSFWALSFLIISLFLVSDICASSTNRYGELSWTDEAAKKAELVASNACSGHGRAYLDSLVLDGTHQPLCECNKCYRGPNCSEFIQDCPAYANYGDPYVLEPFWMKHAACSSILVSGWHRLGYEFGDGTLMSKRLEMQIRKLHATVGNAVTEGKFIVFGVGSSQLLSAAVYALSPNLREPAKVVATAPYFNFYDIQTNMANSKSFEFGGDTSLWTNCSDNRLKFIEFVTAPNNPDGKLNKAVLHGPNVKYIHDHAYYWPQFTAIPVPSDEDLMTFTLSKLTGHCGTRFGWALVKDKLVFERMKEYITFSVVGVSRDAQLRVLQILEVVLEGDGRAMFEFGYKAMRERWITISNIMSKSTRFSLQDIATQYCTFFETTRGPSPPFAWVKCEREEETDCYAVFERAKILGKGGPNFRAENRYMGFSLIVKQEDFDNLVHRLRKLVAEEERFTSIFAMTLSNLFYFFNIYLIELYILLKIYYYTYTLDFVEGLNYYIFYLKNMI